MIFKICGMKRQEDLEAAASCGFDFCGFIFHPASPRFIRPEDARALNSGSMKRVGVFVEQGADEIMAIMRVAKLDYAQLHGAYSPEAARELGASRVIRVLWPQKYASIAEMQAQALEYAACCSYFLLDAGMSGGGSGEALAWKSLSGLNLGRPWLLAGGLNERNARDAVLQCKPDGLDFNSGLEAGPGIKNVSKLRAVSKLKMKTAGA